MRPLRIGRIRKPKRQFRHATSARKMAARREKRAHWLGLFRPTVDHFGKKIARIQGTPPSQSKDVKKRERLAQARKINPAVRSTKGAIKLDRRLTREAKAGA